MAFKEITYEEDGPMMGSFNAGHGTWYLEDLIGKKRAKEYRYANPKMTAAQASEIGLSRVTHDLLLSQDLGTEESMERMESFAERRQPNATRFGH